MAFSNFSTNEQHSTPPAPTKSERIHKYKPIITTFLYVKLQHVHMMLIIITTFRYVKLQHVHMMLIIITTYYMLVTKHTKQ